MSTNEVYFLILVCGAFGALAIGLAAATIRYHHWQKQALSVARRPDSRTARSGR